jgi:hypothetical protein
LEIFVNPDSEKEIGRALRTGKKTEETVMEDQSGNRKKTKDGKRLIEKDSENPD